MQDMAHPAGREHGRGLEVHARGPASTRHGGAVCIRAVSSGDEEGLRGMFSRLSKKTIYQRLHMPYPRVPGWALASFMHADVQAASLVAVVGEEIIGHAIYVRSDSGRDDEFALVVEDRWQSQGWGNYSSLSSPGVPGIEASRPLPGRCSERTGACSGCWTPSSSRSIIL